MSISVPMFHPIHCQRCRSRMVGPEWPASNARPQCRTCFALAILWECRLGAVSAQSASYTVVGRGWWALNATLLCAGIFAGVSSGGSISAALRLSDQVEGATIVAIVCDRGDRYSLSSQLDRHMSSCHHVGMSSSRHVVVISCRHTVCYQKF